MPSFSNNYQIKIMATGESGGQWGDFTNENLLRIEQALGGSFLDLDITAGDDAGSSYLNDVYTWVVQDTTDAFTSPGSSGRAKFVEFTADNPDTPGADQTIEIRGNTSSDKVTRIYFVKNAIAAGNDILLDNGGTDYKLLNGCYAAIYCNAATSSVANMLSNLQIENLTFPEAAVINVLDGNANALEIKSATRDFLTFDSNATGGRVFVDAALKSDSGLILESAVSVASKTPLIDWSDTATNLEILDSSASALVIKDSANTHITINTTTDVVTVPNLTVSTALVSSTTTTLTGTTTLADIDISNQVTDIILANNTAAALEFKEKDDAGTSYLTFNTSTNAVEFPKPVTIGGALNVTGSTSTFANPATFNDAATFAASMVLGDNKYIAFNSLAGTPANSYGFRDLNGVVEAKDDGGDWENVVPEIIGLDGATEPVDSSNKKGFIKFGGIGIWFDRRDIAVVSAEIDLQTYFSVIYTVNISQSEADGDSRNLVAFVTDGDPQSITVKSNADNPRVGTILAIGAIA